MSTCEESCHKPQDDDKTVREYRIDDDYPGDSHCAYLCDPCADRLELAGRPHEIQFAVKGKPMLQLFPDGRILVFGRPAGSDAEVVAGLRKYLIGIGAAETLPDPKSGIARTVGILRDLAMQTPEGRAAFVQADKVEVASVGGLYVAGDSENIATGGDSARCVMGDCPDALKRR